MKAQLNAVDKLSAEWSELWRQFQPFVGDILAAMDPPSDPMILYSPPQPITLPPALDAPSLRGQIQAARDCNLPAHRLVLGTGSDYLQLLEGLMASPWTPETMQEAFRWVAFGQRFARPADPVGSRLVWHRPALVTEQDIGPGGEIAPFNGDDRSQITEAWECPLLPGKPPSAAPLAISFARVDLGVGWFSLAGRMLGYAIYPRLGAVVLVHESSNLAWERLATQIFGDAIMKHCNKAPHEISASSIGLVRHHPGPTDTQRDADAPLILHVLHTALQGDQPTPEAMIRHFQSRSDHHLSSARIRHGYVRCLLQQVEVVESVLKGL